VENSDGWESTKFYLLLKKLPLHELTAFI